MDLSFDPNPYDVVLHPMNASISAHLCACTNSDLFMYSMDKIVTRPLSGFEMFACAV